MTRRAKRLFGCLVQKKSKMREQFSLNFKGKNIEIFAYCEWRIFYTAHDDYTWLHFRANR